MQENGTPAEESDRRGYAIDPYEVCGRGEINFCRGERTKELLRYRKEKDMFILNQARNKIIDTSSRYYFGVGQSEDFPEEYSLIWYDCFGVPIEYLGDYVDEELAYQALYALANSMDAFITPEDMSDSYKVEF